MVWFSVWVKVIALKFHRERKHRRKAAPPTAPLSGRDIRIIISEPIDITSDREVAKHPPEKRGSRSGAPRDSIIPATTGRAVLPPAIKLTSPTDLKHNRNSLKSPVYRDSRRISARRRRSKPLPPLPPSTPRSPQNLLLSPQSTYSRASSSRGLRLFSPRKKPKFMSVIDTTGVKAILKVVYEYEAQSADEIDIKEDQIVYLLDDSDEDWSKIQLHLTLDELASTPAPKPTVGLVPAAYLGPHEPLAHATALYDYDANGDGEISIVENERMEVYIREDDWIFVGINRPSKNAQGEGRFGFIPGNYVEEGDGDAPIEPTPEPEPERAAVPPPAPIAIPPPVTSLNTTERAKQAKASIKDDPVETWNASEVDKKGKKKKGSLGVGNGAIFFASESDKNPVQQISSSTIAVVTIDSHKSKHVIVEFDDGETIQFNAASKDEAEAIVEKMDSSRRIAKSSQPSTSNGRANGAAHDTPSPPPAASAAPRFLPPPVRNDAAATAAKTKSRGVHFDSAPPTEIAPRKGVQSDDEADEAELTPQDALGGQGDPALAMYDFDADGEDELSVKEGERLLVIDKEGSDEWWRCRDSNGNEGVVPASYLELEYSEDAAAQEAARAKEAKAKQAEEEKQRKRQQEEADRRKKEAERRRAAEEEERRRSKEEERRSMEQERREQERKEKERQLAKERKDKARESNQSKTSTHRPSGSKDLPGRPSSSSEKPKPTNTRTWHDRTGQFKVEAELLQVKDGMIRLHKVNGVIIEVPVEKMSKEDKEFIDGLQSRGALPTGARATSPQVDEDNIPLDTLRRNRNSVVPQPQPPPKKPAVDWFDFFLSAGCDLDDSTRYATSFEKDKMDAAILSDVGADTLRAIGLREGDIIRVLKQIEKRGWKLETSKADDPRVKRQLEADEELARRLQKEEFSGRASPGSAISPAPGLFTGPGGVLKNNTRRGRPTPSKSASLAVDADAITSASNTISRTNSPNISGPGGSRSSPPERSNSASLATVASGFGDDAWTPRPASAAGTKSAAATAPAPKPLAAPTLQPTPVAPAPAPPPAPPVAPPAPAVQVSAAPAQQQATGNSIQRPATSNAPSAKLPSEFDNLAKIGSWRPPSAPIGPSATGTSTLSPLSAPPISFNHGLGMGSNPTPMGTFLAAQQTGVLGSPFNNPNGPRGPLAPVPANQGLLQPLIPTNTGFNSFVPTRPSSIASSVTNTTLGSASYLTPQSATFGGGSGFAGSGFNPMGNAQQMPPMGVQSHITGLGNFQNPLMGGGSQPSLTMQPTGMPGFNSPSPNLMSPNSLQPQPTGMFGGGMFSGLPNTQAPPPFMPSNPGVKDTSPANIFASMKTGTFANESAPQSSDKYDALRTNSTSPGFLTTQPTGWAALNALQAQPTGFQQQGGFPGQPGFQNQQGFQQGYPNNGYGFGR